MKFTVKAAINAVRAIGPYPKKIADSLGVTTSAFYQRMEKYPSLREAYESEIEGQFDTAETTIIQNIKTDPRIALEFMKTKGKSRGYSTRVETTGPGGGPIRQAIGPDLENMSNDALANYVNGLFKTALDVTGAKTDTGSK